MNRLRIRWLPHADNPAYAGVRFRCLLPMQSLHRAGQDVALFDAGERAVPDVLIVQAKWLLDSCDIRTLQDRREMLATLQARGCRMVLDSFDNYFLNRNDDPARAEKLRLFVQAIHGFDRYSCASSGLLPVLREQLGPDASINVIEDPLETREHIRAGETPWRTLLPRRLRDAWHSARFRAAIRKERAAGTRQLLWFGNHGSHYAAGGMDDLARIAPLLQQLQQTHALSLTVISNSEDHYRRLSADWDFPSRYRDWHRLHFLDEMQVHDLVVLPITRQAFTDSKGSNRLVLPLAHGLPVFSDPIPAYREFAPLAELDNWPALAAAVADITPFRQRAQAAAPQLMQRFNLDRIAGQWQQIALAAQPAARL